MNAVDTNILVYAVSRDDVPRERIAVDLLARLTRSDTVLLWQVACEIGAVASRLHAQGVAADDVFEFVASVRNRFPLILPSADVLAHGLRIHRDDQVSYWDALLIAACADAGVETLYSEDVPSRSVISGVRIVNPFNQV